jgi:hypothetical protein
MLWTVILSLVPEIEMRDLIYSHFDAWHFDMNLF